MRDKHAIMKIHIDHGISNLDEIKQSYNQYKKGGGLTWEQQMQKKRLAAAQRQAANPDIITQISNAMSYPMTWISHPSRIAGDVNDILHGRLTQTDKENYQHNVNVKIGKEKWHERPTQLAPQYLTNALTSIAGSPKTILSVWLGDVLAGDNRLEATNSATGLIVDKKLGGLHGLGEFQKQAGGITDINQAIQNVQQGQYGQAAWNTLTGAAGLFNSSMLPSGWVRTAANADKIDKFVEGLNVVGDIADVAKPVYEEIKSIFEKPKPVKSTSILQTGKK